MLQIEIENVGTFEEYELAASVCREDFYFFVQEFWDTIIQEEPLWNWHIEYLCQELQYIAERVFLGLPCEYDLVINIPPGTTKSTICSIMFPPWVWSRMPSARIIGASYAETLQMDLSRTCRNVIRSDKYQLYFPEVQISDDQDAKSYFMNIKGGRRKGVGVGGIAGFHAHFILVDDPIDPKEAVSQTKIEAANWWMDNSLAFRKVDKELTPTILIMQRICQGDPTDNMLSKEGRKIKHICLPGELTDDVNPPELKQRYVNGLLDPVRLTRRFINSVKEQEFTYKAQILQKPIPLGGKMFYTERLHIESVAPVLRELKSIIRYWDKAGTKDGGAFSAGVKMTEDRKGRIWILDVKRGQWDSATREEHIKQTAQVDEGMTLTGIEQEPGSGGKESAENTVKNLKGFKTFVERPTGDKAQRAEPFSCQVNAGNVYLVKADWNQAYINELQFFSLLNSKYKDQVDASSGAFNRLTKPKPTVAAGWNNVGKG